MPLGSNIQTVGGLGARGNEQRLTIDVTLSPRLEDLRQGRGMPGHASCSTLGHHPGPPDSTSLAIKLARVPLRSDPSLSSMNSIISNVKSSMWLPHQEGIRGITLVGSPPDITVKVNVRGTTLEVHS